MPPKVLPANPPPWGIAFSYNCGARARDFYAGIWLTWDGVMPSAGSYHHGRSGSGYRMETYSWEDLWQLDGGEFNGGNIRMPTALLVRSVCTWHVRAVAGDEATVARYIPPIPRSAKRWGNCVDDACSRVVPYLVH